MAHVVSVLVGRPEKLRVGKRTVTTGIHKKPAGGPVHVGEEGLRDDAVLDTRHHGGLDQAVYLTLAEDLAWFGHELGEVVAPGRFGENLVIDGLGDLELRIGDRLRLPHVELQLTAPRIPCNVLAAAMGDKGFVTRYRDARRPGAYARVLRAGPVQAGDPVEHVPSDGIGLLEVYDEWYARPHDAERLRRALASPLAQRTRDKLEGWLAKAR